MQPINSNNALKGMHCLYTGGTGSGKTTAVQEFGRIKATDQVVFWDPHEDYQGFKGRVVRRYKRFSDFFAALKAGRRTKQGFKIALTVPETRENFLKFGALVKGFGNGEHAKLLHVVCEEVPQVTESLGKEKSVYGWLLHVGRKFGFVIHSVGQRVTDMSKSTLTQSEYKWIGSQGSRADAERMAKEADVSVDEIMALQPLQYIFKKPGMGNIERGAFTPKNS